MVAPKQKSLVFGMIDSLLEKGMTNKSEIYSKVVEETGLPRPTVRRITRDYRNELSRRVEILQSEIPNSKNNF